MMNAQEKNCCWPIGMRSLLLLAFVYSVTVPALAEQRPLTLVADGDSQYVVLLSADASPSEKWAAGELASHFRQMSGATLDVQTEGESLPAKAILIGDGQAVRSVGVKLDTAALGPDGFVIKTIGDRLVIAGGRQRGTMYGVFTLLEKLGCRWWYPGASTIPSVKTIRIADMDERHVPVLEYRDMLYGEMDNSEGAMIWRARNKVNGGFYKDMKPEYGGAWKFHTLVHSYDGLLPPRKYFNEHPAYYALRAGKHNPGQPCFSNKDVVRLMAESITRLIAAHPDWRFFTIGQNDNSSYCECDDCNALAKRCGSHGGAQVHFAKEIAAIVRERHAGVIINVPAYRWTRQPPTGIVPDDKMAITLCSIECNFGSRWPRDTRMRMRRLRPTSKGGQSSPPDFTFGTTRPTSPTTCCRIRTTMCWRRMSSSMPTTKCAASCTRAATPRGTGNSRRCARGSWRKRCGIRTLTTES